VSVNAIVNRSQLDNAFEFVVIASLRAKQLLQGSLPKLEPSAKPARTAQREVAAGLVWRIDDDAATDEQ
jgi:DNA-directed RNA polymerase subunit K/omega